MSKVDLHRDFAITANEPTPPFPRPFSGHLITRVSVHTPIVSISMHFVKFGLTSLAIRGTYLVILPLPANTASECTLTWCRRVQSALRYRDNNYKFFPFWILHVTLRHYHCIVISREKLFLLLLTDLIWKKNRLYWNNVYFILIIV